jgi:hypothetical protein
MVENVTFSLAFVGLAGCSMACVSLVGFSMASATLGCRLLASGCESCLINTACHLNTEPQTQSEGILDDVLARLWIWLLPHLVGGFGFRVQGLEFMVRALHLIVGGGGLRV